MLVFEISRAWVFAALDLPTTDIRLVSALVVLAALAVPKISERWREWRSKRRPGLAVQDVESRERV
jgi:ABC-type uncharacterized transport system permease subunit